MLVSNVVSSTSQIITKSKCRCVRMLLGLNFDFTHSERGDVNQQPKKLLKETRFS